MSQSVLVWQMDIAQRSQTPKTDCDLRLLLRLLLVLLLLRILQLDLASRVELAEEVLRVEGDGCGEGLFVAGKLQVLWYSPRVPAGAASAKGHCALGHFLSGRIGDDHGRIERGIAGRGHLLAVLRRPLHLPDLLAHVLQAADQKSLVGNPEHGGQPDLRLPA